MKNTNISNMVILNKKLTDDEFRLYCVLVMLTDNDESQSGCVSIKTLAEISGKTHETIRKERTIVMTGYPSIDKPWLKYYSDEAKNRSLPQETMYHRLIRANKGKESAIARAVSVLPTLLCP